MGEARRRKLLGKTRRKDKIVSVKVDKKEINLLTKNLGFIIPLILSGKYFNRNR